MNKLKIIIAEKPSVSKIIKDSLNDPSYLYLSVSGHIMTIQYNKFQAVPWSKVTLKELLEDQYVFRSSKTKFGLKDLSTLKKLKKIDELILACDPDHEGAFIEKQILDYLKTNSVVIDTIYSVSLESMAKKDVIKAFQEKKVYDPTLAYPGELRARLDFLFGSVLTRKASLDLVKINKYWKTYNTGRVQTPTLCQIIKREDEIKMFKPEVYYNLKVRIPKVENSILLLKVHEEKLCNEFLSTKKLELSLLETVDHIVGPRDGLNTDHLLRLLATEHACFRKLGRPVTSLLNKMYLEGKITYPRTENFSYKNYQEALKDFSLLYEKQFHKPAVMQPCDYKDKGKNKKTDHGPIGALVTSAAVTDQFELKVLKTLFSYAKTMFSGSNHYKIYRYKLSTDIQDFFISISRAMTINYDDKTYSSSTFEPLTPKELKQIELEVVKDQTKCPAYYTPVTLLSVMTRNRLGTKSTKPIIIQNLLENKYVYFEKKNYLRPNYLGRSIIDYWRANLKQITQPTLTSNIEKSFTRLSTYEEVLKEEETYRKFLLKQLNL